MDKSMKNVKNIKTCLNLFCQQIMQKVQLNLEAKTGL